jgi:WhiB family redox-sensing transcriptional regulator
VGAIPAAVDITTHDWMTSAACHGLDPELFFSAAARDGRAARAACVRCPVRRPCLAYALADPALTGIWAGTTPLERAELRRSSATATPPP